MCCSNPFINLMHSLDSAFLALQGIGLRHPNSWGERFFRELTANYPEWSCQKIRIYMKASEILNSFSFNRRKDELSPALIEKPEALLRMVLMLIRHSESDLMATKPSAQHSAEKKAPHLNYKLK